MDDWEKYEQLADTPKYRDDFEFAMYGATHFGMKAIPILATAPTYGDKYPELIKAACEKSLLKGDFYARATDIDADYLEISGLGKTAAYSMSSNNKLDEVTITNSRISLKDVVQFSDQRINEIKAERLHEKISNKLAVKPSPPTRGIKI